MLKHIWTKVAQSFAIFLPTGASRSIPNLHIFQMIYNTHHLEISWLIAETYGQRRSIKLFAFRILMQVVRKQIEIQGSVSNINKT